MHHSTSPAPIGLIWFDKQGQPRYLVAPQSDVTVACDAIIDCPAGYYLTNLDYQGLHQWIDELPEWGDYLMHQRGLLANTANVADELGMPDILPSDLTPELNAILVTVKQSFNQACFRLGLDLRETGVRTRRIQQRVFSRTASAAMQETSIEEAGVAFSPTPHRWVTVPTVYSDDIEVVRVSMDRKMLYGSLLATAVPVGEWLEGDDKASSDIVLSAVSDHHDILLEATLHVPTEAPSSFPASFHTDEPRNLFTGQEVRRLVKEGISFDVHRWWHGPTAPAPKLLPTHAVSLSDGLMLEMVHRSWRENPEIGFWLSIAERLALHGFARKLHDGGVEVRGFGTGKVMVRCQKSLEAKNSLITRLLKQNKGYGLQFSLSDLRAHPALPELLEFMTDQQSVAIASPSWLAELDSAIREGDKEVLAEHFKGVDKALSALVGAPETEQ